MQLLGYFILVLVITLSIDSCKAYSVTCNSPNITYNSNGSSGVTFCRGSVNTLMRNPQLCISQVNQSGLKINIKMNFGTFNVYRMDVGQDFCFSISGTYNERGDFSLTASSNNPICQGYQCLARITVFYD